MLKILLNIVVLSFLVFACQSNTKHADKESEEVIATIGTQVLTKEDFFKNSIKTINSSDSAIVAKQQIDNWITESLFYEEAISKLLDDEMDINKQVEEYKKNLVNYIYQTKLIEANIDTTISNEEIENYYNQNIDNFLLKDNIVKVNYYKIPLKASGLEKMKKLFNTQKENEKLQLNNLALENADNFFNNDSTWLYLEDIKKEIPDLRNQPDLILNKGKTMEFSDNEYYYYLKIKDEKTRNNSSPLSFEKNNIKTLIVNKRKTDLINSYKKQLLSTYYQKNKPK
ncbi:MAG: hypothetical protein LCH32_11960 [Bacteroidetes bacterium]|nr:hypothetical protein [Bacteroidota bacterium]